MSQLPIHSKTQLWQLIEKIAKQYENIQATNKAANLSGPLLNKFNQQSAKLARLVELRRKCLHAEKCLREKQLALMRERNLYLEKCR